MSNEPLVIGVALLIVGFVLNVASPHLSPSLNANLGLWGGFFAIIGLIIIAIRLRAMMAR
jgi:hypothetical protein